MLTDFLLSEISQTLEPIVTSLKEGERQIEIDLRRSARASVITAIYKSLKRPILVITDHADRASMLTEEISIWKKDIPTQIFPEPTAHFYEGAAWGEATRRERLMVLSRLAEYHLPGSSKPTKHPIVIATVRSLMARTIPRRDFLKSTRVLRQGQDIQIQQLAETLILLGYESTNIVIAPGQFAHRGGIFDLWLPTEGLPIRLDFFGDIIDAIRQFKPSTQRTIKSESKYPEIHILVTPAREFVLKGNTPLLDNGESYTEFHIPILHPTPASLLDYLPSNALVILEDSLTLKEIVHEIEEKAVINRQESILSGIIRDDFPIPYLSLSELQDSLYRYQKMEIRMPSTRTTEADAEYPSDENNIFDLGERFSSAPRFGGQLKSAMVYLQENNTAGEKQIIVSRHIARLKELWQKFGSNESSTEIRFLQGSLSEGWIFESINKQRIQLITDGELFGWRSPKKRQRKRAIAEAPELNYSDLEINDWVVHVDHGIGKFLGLVHRTIDNIQREYLCIEYADQAELFVPVYQADRITRYIGSDNRFPKINRLGSVEWRNVKTYVKQAVQDIAEELLELYAKRSVVEGYPFSPDIPWQDELEASFPYIETDDQIRVLSEVKRDMQSKKPMDRLICGDVGYGKTEVALRAAFKAVLDGKQVAILVPTTVLAQQHFNTFSKRLAAFPVEVEMLSRFRTPKQQRHIVSRLSEGKVDIVIGTHRLISNDVSFKDLGLLIIDEEQRFGVTHKEKLKRMRTEVDILTLTATPIPRTLYMALSGVRDISTINTPPEERQPVVTHVGPYSPQLIRQAILREIERGGQVFFVHNRVHTIPAMLSHLFKIVPEAQVEIAHGQMAEKELERRMELFTQGKVDVLLTTSIIESGLDIPNANTLIVDRADTFGLAQLYQLRGRVGRGAHRAYAYFFRHKKKTPTPEGRLRLETIAENTHLGAGYSIAMRDLEIRGAGDILGSRQHGHIASVGFHLYTSLLSEAVSKIRQEHGHASTLLPPTENLQLNPVNIELPFQASIPIEYIPDRNTRLGLYRRMADMQNSKELEALQEEFIDRFGPYPEELQNLFYQLKIKILAEDAKLTSIMVENKQIVFRYPFDEMPDWLPSTIDDIRIGKTALWFPYQNHTDWRERLIHLLQILKEYSEESLKITKQPINL
jgi:transcription-repair coupling factor (superfamily II helicase)